MSTQLSFEAFDTLAQSAARIAVFQTVSMAPRSAASLYQQLVQTLHLDGIILENLSQSQGKRYSYLCFEPSASFVLADHSNVQEPLSALRRFYLEHQVETDPRAAHQITTIAGWVSYDAVRYFEDIPHRHAEQHPVPNILFHFYDLSLTLDHEQQTLLISTVVKIDGEHHALYQQAQMKIKKIIDLIHTPFAMSDTTNASSKAKAIITPDLSDQAFSAKVERAKNYIQEGDAFQIVLSRCFKRPYTVAPIDIYACLARLQPAPYLFYFPSDYGTFIGASPETFLRFKQGQVQVNPIAGTKPRSSETDDASIAAALLNDPKEIAEHTMLVDLARNDLGVVCQPGSVQVAEWMQVKHYAYVSHITSTVVGQCRDDEDVFTAFKAAFPAGTLSGAPKIRAMEIIDTLETSARGLYGGAICRFNAAGDFDSAIAIRMAQLLDGVATVRTGAGVVFDSDPMREAAETKQKASHVLAAIAVAEGE